MENKVIFSSDNSFLGLHKFKEVRKKAEKEDVDIEEIKIDDTDQELPQNSNLFSKDKLALVRSSFNKDRLVDLIERLFKQGYSFLILNYCSKGYKLDFDDIKTEDLTDISSKDFIRFGQEYAEKFDINITKKAIKEIENVFGLDTWALATEIQKAALSGLDTIKSEDLNIDFKTEVQDQVFDMIEALFSNRKEKALEILTKELDHGTAPRKILGALFYQFRSVFKAKNLPKQEAGMQKWKYNKIQKQTKGMADKELERNFEDLVELYDNLIVSNQEPRVLISNFLLQF